MINKRDLAKISEEYFEIIRVTSCYVELMSKNTQHCWIVYKVGVTEKFPVWLYHKHSKDNQCYHLQRKKKSFKSTLSEIQSHDMYCITGRKSIFCNT